MIKRPTDPNPLFSMDESDYVIKGRSPFDQQRYEDGTPMTKSGIMCDQPKEPGLYISDSEILEKAFSESKPEPKPDPAEVVKSYLIAKGVAKASDFDVDDSE